MKSCVNHLINFSDEISTKFLQVGERKDKNVLDCGLAASDNFFWQEVHEKYQVTYTSHDNIAFVDVIFEGIDPSMKLNHSWSKL
jgi:hypothetical protein